MELIHTQVEGYEALKSWEIASKRLRTTRRLTQIKEVMAEDQLWEVLKTEVPNLYSTDHSKPL